MPPGIELVAERVHRSDPIVLMPVHGHPFPFLPALHSGDVALEVRGNLLPGIEAAWRAVGGLESGRLVHRAQPAKREWAPGFYAAIQATANRGIRRHTPKNATCLVLPLEHAIGALYRLLPTLRPGAFHGRLTCDSN